MLRVGVKRVLLHTTRHQGTSVVGRHAQERDRELVAFSF